MTLVLLGLALAAGYGLGRARPLARLRDWTAWTVRGYGRQAHWHNHSAGRVVLAAFLILTDPHRFANALRRARAVRD